MRMRGISILVSFLLALPGCRPSPPPSTGGKSSGGKANTPFVARLVRVVDPQVDRLKGIAVDEDGAVYLAARSGVVVFGPLWNRKRELPTPSQAAAVAVADDGTVFVAERQRVHVFDREGTPAAGWGVPGEGRGQLSFITGIAVSGPNVWIADAGNRVVHRFDLTGDFIDDLGGPDPNTGEPGIICPSPYLDCAAAPDGTLYVANPGRWRIEHYDLNNHLVGHWGRWGVAEDRFAGCCNPTNLAVTRDGRFITAEKGTPRVKVLDAEGSLLAVMPADRISLQSSGMDLAVDKAGRIYVAEPAAGRVLVFELEKRP